MLGKERHYLVCSHFFSWVVSHEEPEPELESFLDSEEEVSLGVLLLELSSGFCWWAGWLVRLCQRDLRKPSFLWASGESGLVER